MASTYSPLLGIELIGIGDQNNTWGTTTNTNLGTLLEQAIAGSTTIDVTAGNVTMSDYDGSSDESRNAIIRIIGTPGVSRNIVAPASSKVYYVINGSNAAVVLKTSVSTGVTIPSGATVSTCYDTTTLDFKLASYPASSINSANTLVLRDSLGSFGANVVAANIVSSTTLSGDLNGTINTATTATTQSAGDNSTKVATTAYVSTAVTNATAALGTMSTQNANNVNITGGTLSGVSGTLNSVTLGTNGSGTKTISTSAPSGGSDGDVWYRYS